MGLTQPLISIIIPCYNVANTISDTISSALNQTYKDLEIIVVNDGSTDNLVVVLQPFLKQHETLHFYEQEYNKGLPSTRNLGFQKSQGEYIVFLDGDDLIAPEYVEECHKKFEQDMSLSLVHTETILFEGKQGKFKLPTYSFRQMLITNCITATAMIRRDYLQAVGLYDEKLNFFEDWELWIRYLNKYPKTVKVNKPLFFYRQRLTNDSMSNQDKTKNVSDYALLYIYHKHYELYREHGYGLNNLMWLSTYRKKHYLKWYRRFFYKLFKPKKFRKLMKELH